MASIRISANSGSHTLKTSGFSDSMEKPATNSEPYYVNIDSRDIIGSNPVRHREMRTMSQFQGRHSHDQVSSVRDRLCHKVEVQMRCVLQRHGRPVAAIIVHAHAESEEPKRTDPTDNSGRGLDGPDDVGRMKALCRGLNRLRDAQGVAPAR